MELTEARRIASQLSGGTSSGMIKDFVIECLRFEQASGSLIDFGAGKGELLARLAQLDWFTPLAGMDVFPRPAELDHRVEWFQQDLNDTIHVGHQYDCVICSETIEHLENPRHTFRCLNQLLKPGGLLILTMPNQESVRSYLGLVLGGHFTHFLGASYPAHITALLRMDLRRLCKEVGFDVPRFRYTNSGGIPKMPQIRWQSVSLGLLGGRLFSDNIALLTRKAADAGAAPDPGRDIASGAS